MHSLSLDFLNGLRMLAKKPGFTSVAVISLGLGIALNTLIFSLINTTLLRPLPFDDAERLMLISSVARERPNVRSGVNGPTYMTWKAQSRSFESIGAFFGSSSNIGAEENGSPAERINGQHFTPSMFQLLRLKPALGRSFTEEEGKIGTTNPAVIISHSLWQRRFGGDPNILGRTMRMDNVLTTIVGVMAPTFNFFQDDAEFWGSFGFTRARMDSGAAVVLVVGRLKPDFTIDQAQSEMDALAAGLAETDPQRNKGLGAFVMPLQEAAFGKMRQPLLLFQGAVAFILLSACANVAGLLIASLTARRTEVAIRSAIGASRWRVFRQLLIESGLLAGIGGILGVSLAWAGMRIFIRLAPSGFPRINELSLDTPVLGFTVLVTLMTGLLFGILPAFQGSRADLANALKDSFRSSGIARQRLRSGLVTLQIGIALVLLIGAFLMINSYIHVQTSTLGFDPDRLLSFDFRLPVNEMMKSIGTQKGVGVYEISPKAAETFDLVRDRLGTLPGVEAIAAASRAPLQGAMDMMFRIDGRSAPAGAKNGETGYNAAYIAVTPNYFSTLRIPILRGRDFTDRDTLTAPLVVLINESMAKRYFPYEDPIGKRITLDFAPDEQPREILGIVGDTQLNRLQRQMEPIIYLPHRQQNTRWLGSYLVERTGMFFILRTRNNPMGFVTVVREAVAQVDQNRPISNIRSVEETLDQQVQYVWLYMLLIGLFGVGAILLAAIGLYGVMAYHVAQRTYEIGIRMALGASERDLLKMVLRQALGIIVIGVVLGIAASLALTRFIASQLWGITPTDPATFIGVSLFLVFIALLACLIPARKAANVAPLVAMRFE